MTRGAACPYLGTGEDPGTYHAFPSPHNCCWKAGEVGIVRAAYQARYCLSSRHLGCRVFRQDWPGPLPVELAYFEPQIRRSPILPYRSLAFIGILLTAVITIGAWTIYLVGLADPGPPAVFIAPTALPTGAPAPSEAPTSTGTPTLTSTPTPSPTATPSPAPTSGPGLETPIGADMPFLIHEVQAGERMADFAARYETDEETIRYVNGIEGWPLWVGEMLLMPVGQTGVGNLPRFAIYQVPADDVLVQAVADLFETDVDALREYNRLGESPTLPAGRWLIVPIIGEE
jgi:hypothetical protein